MLKKQIITALFLCLGANIFSFSFDNTLPAINKNSDIAADISAKINSVYQDSKQKGANPQSYKVISKVVKDNRTVTTVRSEKLKETLIFTSVNKNSTELHSIKGTLGDGTELEILYDQNSDNSYIFKYKQSKTGNSITAHYNNDKRLTHVNIREPKIFFEATCYFHSEYDVVYKMDINFRENADINSKIVSGVRYEIAYPSDLDYKLIGNQTLEDAKKYVDYYRSKIEWECDYVPSFNKKNMEKFLADVKPLETEQAENVHFELVSPITITRCFLDSNGGVAVDVQGGKSSVIFTLQKSDTVIGCDMENGQPVIKMTQRNLPMPNLYSASFYVSNKRVKKVVYPESRFQINTKAMTVHHYTKTYNASAYYNEDKVLERLTFQLFDGNLNADIKLSSKSDIPVSTIDSFKAEYLDGTSTTGNILKAVYYTNENGKETIKTAGAIDKAAANDTKAFVESRVDLFVVYPEQDERYGYQTMLQKMFGVR